MAAPSFDQITAFGAVSDKLKQAAIDEFLGEIDGTSTLDEVLEEATRIAIKYKAFGAELGAQWYDLCTQLAGINAEPAYISEVNQKAVAERAEKVASGLAVGAATLDIAQNAFEYFLQNEINRSIRQTGSANLWRDYERGLCGGRFARVPQGEETCAFCMMLASQGAWYLTEESALGTEPDHYHDACDCIAVYHADANSIRGYSKLAEYKGMYYEADNRRIANAKGIEPYDGELKERINKAKARHELLEENKVLEAAERGEEYEAKPWTVYNEDLILMRERYGLK